MLLVKPNLNVLPKATAVVVPCRLGVPEGLSKTYIYVLVNHNHFMFLSLFSCGGECHLHDGAGGKDSILNTGLTRGAADGGKVAHSILSRDCFASARLTTHYDGLASSITAWKCDNITI